MKRCWFSIRKPLPVVAALAALLLIPGLPASSDEQYGFNQCSNSNYVQATANNTEGDWMGWIYTTYTLHSDHWMEMWNYQETEYRFTMGVYLDIDSFGSSVDLIELRAPPNGTVSRTTSLSKTFSTGGSTANYEVHAGTHTSAGEGLQVVGNHLFVIVL